MKRFLPLLSLILVSVLVSICALSVIFVLSLDAVTMEEKVQSMLTLGVLLWFGAGMDQVLSRLKNRSTRVEVSLLTYILVPVVLCVGLPALAAFVIYGVFNAPMGWQQLPAPPEPAVEVAAAGELSVIVRTEADEYFFCGVSAPSDCWQSTDAPEQKMSGRGTETDIPTSSAPPGEAVSLLGLSYTDLGVEGRTYYAALQDGSVWTRQQNNNTYDAGFASSLFLMIAIIPALFGLIVIYVSAGMSAVSRWVANRGE